MFQGDTQMFYANRTNTYESDIFVNKQANQSSMTPISFVTQKYGLCLISIALLWCKYQKVFLTFNFSKQDRIIQKAKEKYYGSGNTKYLTKEYNHNFIYLTTVCDY